MSKVSEPLVLSSRYSKQLMVNIITKDRDEDDTSGPE